MAARRRRLPAPGLVGLVLFGTQFPDLVDKPLAHVLHVIPSGRVFMHSLPFAVPVALAVCWYALPFAVPVALAVCWYAWRTGRLGDGVAFGFAYASHIVTDARRALFGTDPRIPAEMLWPFVPVAPGPGVPHWAGIGSTTLHVWAIVSVVALASASYVFGKDLRTHVGTCARGPT